MAVYHTAITLSAEDREFHWGDALRLRALAQTITTPTVRDRVLERAYEHAPRRSAAICRISRFRLPGNQFAWKLTMD